MARVARSDIVNPVMGPAVADDATPGRWRMLALLALAELLGMSLWFAGSAMAPQLQARFQLSGTAVAALTTAVQIGFVFGTAGSALLNLADVIPARRFFAGEPSSVRWRTCHWPSVAHCPSFL